MSAITKALRKMRAEGMAVQSDSARKRALQDKPISAATRKGIPLGEEMRTPSGYARPGMVHQPDPIVVAANGTNRMIMVLLALIVAGFVSLGAGFVAMDVMRRFNPPPPEVPAQPAKISAGAKPRPRTKPKSTSDPNAKVVQILPIEEAEPDVLPDELLPPPMPEATPRNRPTNNWGDGPDAAPKPVAAISPQAKARNMRIEGIFWDSKRPMAIIDGEIVEKDGEIGEATVVDITPTSITYLIDGQRVKITP